MQVYLLMDKEETLYGVFTDKDIALQGETDTVKIQAIELRNANKIEEVEKEVKYNPIYKIEYDSQSYWFMARHHGLAIVDLFLILNRPKGFIKRLGCIYEYSTFEKIGNIAVEGFEKPEVKKVSILAKNILRCLHDWNRELCALSISNLTDTILTEEDLKRQQIDINTSLNEIWDFPEDLSGVSVEDVQKAVEWVCGFLILEDNVGSIDYISFWTRQINSSNKTQMLFWMFIYKSCIGITNLPYFLYKCIIEDQFLSFAEEYRSKKISFRDYNEWYLQPGTRKIKRKGQVWRIGSTKEESDYLFGLVKSGVKNATSYIYDESFIAPLQYSILTNWDGSEKVQLETLSCYIIPFKEVSKYHAYAEVEGQRSLDVWKTVHKKFFSRQLALKGKEFDENTLIVCEEFILCEWMNKV